jgi:hypothetical protein
MAASDARPVPRKNVAYRVYLAIFDADGDLVTGATGLDSEISKDGGTFADCTNEATEIATSSGCYYLDLTSTEMDADSVVVIVKTSSSGAKTTPIFLYPEEAGDIRCDVVQISGDATAADNAELMFDGTGYAGGTTKLGVVVVSMAANTLTASALAADAVTEIQSGLSTLDAAGVRTAVGLASANLDTQLAAIDDLVDTEVAAIKTVVDAVLVDTNELQTDWADGGRLDVILDARASQTSVDTVDDFLDTEIAAIKAKTDNLPASPAAVGSAMTLTSGERTAVADALLDRDMSTGTDSGSATVRTVRQALRFLRNKWSLSGTTLTVTKEDDSTASWTATVTTNAAAEPITASDPASS